MINPIDRDELRHRPIRRAVPPLLPRQLPGRRVRQRRARRVPIVRRGQEVGWSFKGVNERGKYQITDSRLFAEPIAELNRELASPPFLDLMSTSSTCRTSSPTSSSPVAGSTRPARGRLDVHVDFNYIEDRALHRRLNILIYFNKDWHPSGAGTSSSGTKT